MNPILAGVTRRALLGAAGSLAAPALLRAQSTSQPIRLGEVNSYSAQPGYTEQYRNGWTMAVDAVNARGGVLGRRLEVISRDDAGQPQDAVRAAGELLGDARADLLIGGLFSNIGLALSDFASHQGRLYVAGLPQTDALVWAKGRRTTFHLRPSTYMLAAMLAEEAAKLPATRWATLAPNYELGQSAVKWFRQLLVARRPDVAFVAEQWPALNKIDAGATVAALATAKPEAIFNATFGADLAGFVRQGNTRGLFDGRSVVSMLTGEPEYLLPLGDEAPPGWIVTGYPVDSLDTPASNGFAATYRARFARAPAMASVVGATMIDAAAAGIARAGGLGLDALVTGFEGAAFLSPFGPAHFRALDHQSTLGAFVGRLALTDGHGTMTGWRYVDGAALMPGDDAVRAMRAVD